MEQKQNWMLLVFAKQHITVQRKDFAVIFMLGEQKKKSSVFN